MGSAVMNPKNVHISESGMNRFLGERISQNLKNRDLRILFSRNLRMNGNGKRVIKPGIAYSVLTSDFNQSVKESLVSYVDNFPIFIFSKKKLCFCWKFNSFVWFIVKQRFEQTLFETPRADPKDVAAIILGGGAGTRLFPLTGRRAKPAVRCCRMFNVLLIYKRFFVWNVIWMSKFLIFVLYLN